MKIDDSILLYFYLQISQEMLSYSITLQFLNTCSDVYIMLYIYIYINLQYTYLFFPSEQLILRVKHTAQTHVHWSLHCNLMSCTFFTIALLLFRALKTDTPPASAEGII